MEPFFTRRKSYINCLQLFIFIETNGFTSNNQLIIVRNLEMQIQNAHVFKCSFSSLFTDQQQSQNWWFGFCSQADYKKFGLNSLRRYENWLCVRPFFFIACSHLKRVRHSSCLRREFWNCYRNEIKYVHSVLCFTVDIGFNM